MTRWQRLTILLVGSALGATLGWYASHSTRLGFDDFMLVTGLVVGGLLASYRIRFVGTVRELIDRSTAPAPLQADLMDASAVPDGRIEQLETDQPDLTLLVPDELRALPSILGPGESVGQLAASTLDGQPGLLAATTARLLFLPKGGGPPEPIFVWDRVTAVRREPGDLLDSIVVTTDTATLEFRAEPDQARTVVL